MKALTTYLHFAGTCRQVMSFYKECFGAELELNTYPTSTGQPSTDPAARIMHAQLTRDGHPILMASDHPESGALDVGNAFSIAIDCESVEEIDRLFAALAQGGEATMPPTDAPWGARFGMLTDKFGIPWMLNCYLQPPK
ncbi:MAG: VOC family protein [Acidobacteriota bacterium]